MPAPVVDPKRAAMPEVAAKGKEPIDPRGREWGGSIIQLGGLGTHIEGRYDGTARSPQALRNLANFFFVSVVIETIMTHLREFGLPQTTPHGVGYCVRLRDVKRPPTKAEQRLIDTATQELFWCGLLRDEEERFYRATLPDYFVMAGYDSLVLDRDFTEFVPDKAGAPAMFRALDGASARFALDEETGYRYPVQVAIDTLQPMKAWKPYDPDGYRARIGVRRRRTDMRSFGYGYPELEYLSTAIFGLVKALETSFSYLQNGLSGAGILSFDDHTHPDQLGTVTTYLRSTATGATNRGRLAVTTHRDGKQPHFISFAQGSLKDMEFLELFRTMVKMVCAGLKVDPAIVGLQFGTEGSGGGLQQSNGRDRIDYAKEKGVWSLARHITRGVDSYWMRPRYPELEVVPGGLDEDTEEIRNARNKEALQWLGFNEVRAREDGKPIDLTKIDNPADVPQPLLQVWTQMQQWKMAQQGQEGGPEGQGEPQAPEDTEGPDGASPEPDDDLMDRLLAAGERSDPETDAALDKALIHYVQRWAA